MKVTVINPQGALGNLPSLNNATSIPFGYTYEVFEISKGSVKLVGMGHIEFNLKDFKFQN